MKKQRIALILIAAGLSLANAGIQAQDTESYNRQGRSKPADTKHGQHIKASKLIGKEVKNDQGDRLGKVEDLIIDSNYSVNFAIISSGGALGVGDKHIAVPINDLNCSGDGIRLSATKEQLKDASKAPTGAWMAVSNEEWTRDIDCYYGQPRKFSMTEPRGYYIGSARTFEREAADTSLEREDVRTVKGDGAKQLITHPDHANLFREPLIGNDSTDNNRSRVATTPDEAMQQRICDNLRRSYTSTTAQAVSVTVQDGVVTLSGTVDNNTEKRNIETSVKQVSRVRRVNNQLTVQSR